MAKGIHGDLTVAKTIAAMSERSVDWLQSGDSNAILGGHGWDHGWQAAITAAGVEMRATGYIQVNQSSGSGTAAGFGYSEASINNLGALTGTPEELAGCLLYTSPSPRDQRGSRMPSSA